MNHPLPQPFLPFENLTDGLTSEALSLYKKTVRDVITTGDLTGDQKRDALAGLAVSSQPYPGVSQKSRDLIRQGVLCMLSEGAAQHHPRYVAPDYSKFLRNGSAFLELSPAENLLDATTKLLIAYQYTSVSSHPVFIGRIDELLEPYLTDQADSVVIPILRAFWLMVDRLFPSAFVHANIGPASSRSARLLLQIERELKTLTNLTLRYDRQTTPPDLALLAVENALRLTKPYFLNHPLMSSDWGDDYCIASCYNAMRIGGGIHTMVRLNIKQAALISDGTESGFLDQTLPEVVDKLVEVINSRSSFLVDQSRWFEHSFQVAEGLLAIEKFTAYAGIFGLAEGVNHIMARSSRSARYGHSTKANQFAQLVTERIYAELQKHHGLYCQGTGYHVCYHAQVGIAEDVDVTPGIRVPAGDEPDLYEHIQAEAPTQHRIQGGSSTILEFDQTAASNPQAVLDIIHGAHADGVRNLSIGSADSEFVRVTGYLVRRSDLEARKNEKAVRHASDLLASPFTQNKPNTLHRRIRKV